MIGKPQGSILAIKISAIGVQALALDRAGAQARVTLIETRSIPPASIPEARHAGLASALRDIARAVEEGPGRESIREIRVVVSGPALTLRLLRVPPMPDREIPAAVRYRLPEICNAPVEGLALDLFVYREGRGERHVLVAALDRTALDEILEPLDAVGLRPAAVIPLCVALVMARSIPGEAAAAFPPEAAAGSRKGEPMRGVLQIGGTGSCLVLERGGRILHAREFALGGDHFTQAIERELGLGHDEAEKVKRAHGIPGPADEAAPGEDPSLIPSIRNLLRPLAERMVAEVRRSIEFTLQEHGGPSLGDLMLTGGGAALRGLDRDLEQDLDVPVRAFRPLADGLTLMPAPGARLDPEGKLDDTLLVCRSAPCLGAAWEKPPVNLVAPRGLSSPARRGVRAAAVVLAMTLGLAIYAGSLWRADRRLDATLRAQEARIRALAPQSVSREALSPEILRAVTGTTDFQGTFGKLDALVPPGVLFESVRLEAPPETPAGAAAGARVLRVEGLAAGAPAAAERSLARLLASVEQSDAFANVQRVRSDEAGRRGEPALRFAFTCEIEQGDAPGDGARAVEDP